MKLETLEDCRAVLAVEIDLGEQGAALKLPPSLDKRRAEELGVRLAADLGELVPGVQRLGLCLAGALYDQTQVLAPGLPLFNALETVYRESLSGSGFQPRMITLGQADGEMARRELAPRPVAAAGPLLLLPLSFTGEPETVRELGAEFETVFIERGQVSPATAMALNEAFGVSVLHARFMTVNDLCAMLRLQLEHIGLPELWDLIDVALFTPGRPLWIRTGLGNAFAWTDNGVDALFQPFDVWSRDQTGAQIAEADQLRRAYTDYLRVWRQFRITLEAHGIPVRCYDLAQPLPAGLEPWLECRRELEPVAESWLSQLARDGSDQGPCQVTVHATDELGAAVFTLEHLQADGGIGRREHFYPLGPTGLQEIQRELRDRAGDGLELCWSDQLAIDAEERCLTGDPSLAQRPASWH